MTTLTIRLDNAQDLVEVLNALTNINMRQIRELGLPPLYASGVVYERETPREEWLTYSQLLERGAGDCEDLAAVLAAELRLRGVAAYPAIVPNGGGGLHAVVWRDDLQRYEDPSKVLGM